MSNNPSKTTVAIASRVSNEVYEVMKRRADKQGITLTEYIRKRLSYDTLRKHGGSKKEELGEKSS